MYFQAFVGICTVIPGDLSTLIDFYSFSLWLFYGATMVALLYLRYKEPDLVRPYKVATIQSCASLNWIYFRFQCGCTPVPVNWNFVVISPCFVIFKKNVHSLEPGETPSSRPLTGLQTMHNVLKFSKSWWNNVKKSIYKNRNETATQPPILSI